MPAEFISGFLPTAGLKIVLAVVPIFLRLMSNYVAGHYSWAHIDFDVGRKYYVFQARSQPGSLSYTA